MELTERRCWGGAAPSNRVQQGATRHVAGRSYRLYRAPGWQQGISAAFLPTAQDVIQLTSSVSCTTVAMPVADFGLAVKMETQDTHISAFQVRADRPWQLQC